MKIDEEFAGIIPPLTEDEYKGLEASILSEGCRDALVIWNDVLVDGHNRYGICSKHNISFKTLTKEFSDRDEVKVWIMRNQLSRRNLNDFQRIETVSKCADAVKAQAEKRKLANLVHSDISLECDKFPFRGRATDELGKLAGVSGKTYERAAEIIDKAPKPIVNAVRKDELSINAGYEVTKLPPKEQEEISERITKGEPAKSVVSEVRDRNRSSELGAIASVSAKTYEKAVKVIEEAPALVIEALRKGDMTINQAYQAVKREAKKAEVQAKIDEHASVQTGAANIYNPSRKYNIIYADPPWRYWESGNKNQALHYPTMTIEEICALPVKELTDKDCALFLWVTYPILREALSVIDSWGFKYSTAAFVWIKTNKNNDAPFLGCGAWTRANSELCLLATKGNVMRLDAGISQVVESPIEEHSRKPAKVRELITRLVGELPRIELFCREPANGWDVWGNEA